MDVKITDWWDAYATRQNSVIAISRNNIKKYGIIWKKGRPRRLDVSSNDIFRKNQPKAAVSLFKKVTKIDPENVNAWYNQGLALNQLKKYADAITCFDMITQRNPNDAMAALNNRGIAMAELGDPEGAMEYYEKAIKADSVSCACILQ